MKRAEWEEGKLSTAEALARQRDPYVWKAPAFNAAALEDQRHSLLRAQVSLGEVWWNAASGEYEACVVG